MKRNHYQIEGDTVVGIGYQKRPKLLDKEKGNSEKSHFSILPLDVLALIVTEVATSSAQDFQNLARYLLKGANISLKEHLEKYPLWQAELLELHSRILENSYPIIFKECRNDRMGRINQCSTIANYNHYSGHKVEYIDQVSSLSAILKASFLELFAFTNHFLCECCIGQFACANYGIDEIRPHSWNGDAPLVHVPLCDKCNHYVNDKMGEAVVDCWTLSKNPSRQYVWLNETKLRRFCELKKSTDLAAYLKSHPIRVKSFTTRGITKPYYLLKDAMPFIIPKFKGNTTEPVFRCGTC